MSTSLYWEPVEPKRELNSLTNQLKYIFGPTYWGHDGTLNGEDVYLKADQIAYLCGIRDATNDPDIKRDADMLINAIQKYGCVKIWLEG